MEEKTTVHIKRDDITQAMNDIQDLLVAAHFRYNEACFLGLIGLGLGCLKRAGTPDEDIIDLVFRLIEEVTPTPVQVEH